MWYLRGPVLTVMLVVNASTRSKPLLPYRMRSVAAVTDEVRVEHEYVEHAC